MAEKRKTLLLTGSTGGLGIAIAPMLASDFDIALHYFLNKTKASMLAETIKKTGAKAEVFYADLTKEREVSALFSEVEKKMGGADVIVNNAGISKNGISWKQSLDDWKKVLDVNLTAPFLCIKHGINKMREKKFGRIINISSVVAVTGFVGTASYSASKSGLFGLTKTISKEVAGKNITVNCIALGYFNTGMINEIPGEIKKEIIESIPEKRLGEPAELAALIKYLASENARYLTGQVINLSGGLA